MNINRIRCCLFGGQEKDLYVLGELHKLPYVDIAFVFDKDPGAVGLEIAEILGIPRVTSGEGLRSFDDVEYAIVSEPRTAFNDELKIMLESGVKILTRTEAMSVLGPRKDEEEKPEETAGEEETYSIEDALAAFERLFDRKKLLKFLLDVGVRAVGASAGSIMMYSEESAELYIAYATGLSERVIKNTRQKLGVGIAGSVAKERKGKLIRKAPGQSLYTTDRDRLDIKSAISVPLMWESKLIGVLNVSSGAKDKELDEEGLTTLHKLSTRISRVLHESLKLQQTQVRHQEMSLRQSMGELSEKQIASNVKFSLISNFLGELIGADTVEIFVGTHEGDWLVLGGSNRRLVSRPDMIRCGKGALSRAYLEKQTIVFTESSERPDDLAPTVSSFAFVPLFLRETLGVLMLEFSDPQKLDEFLWIKDSVTLELSRFIASEKRERNLKKELTALGKVSDAVPLLLTRRTLEELCDLLARVSADILGAQRASVRIIGAGEADPKISFFDVEPRGSDDWKDEDVNRFEKLQEKNEAFSLAFLNFTPETGEHSRAYHSLLAVPIHIDDEFRGGIVVYDRSADNPLDDATFTDLDRSILQHLVMLAVPAVRTLIQPSAAAPAEEEPSYDAVLRGNLQRFKMVIENEMSRSDRYHHSFSLLVMKIKPLGIIFERDYKQALALVDEITRGIQTRTRKTDYGCWIGQDTFAMISLEGTKRIKFLTSRLMLYLIKDFSSISKSAVEPQDFLVGITIYPGTSKSPEALIDEAIDNLEPHQRDA